MFVTLFHYIVFWIKYPGYFHSWGFLFKINLEISSKQVSLSKNLPQTGNFKTSKNFVMRDYTPSKRGNLIARRITDTHFTIHTATDSITVFASYKDGELHVARTAISAPEQDELTQLIAKISTPQQRAQRKALQALDQLVKDRLIFKNSFTYKAVYAALNNPGTFVACAQITGSHRYTRAESWQTRAAIILTRIGVSFEVMNIAPRGGKQGDGIKVIF